MGLGFRKETEPICGECPVTDGYFPKFIRGRRCSKCNRHYCADCLRRIPDERAGGDFTKGTGSKCETCLDPRLPQN